VVVAHSTDGRNGNFVETLGTYDPVVKPTKIVLDTDKALEWLLKGAQPSETVAYILNKVGVLDRLFEQRPAAKKQYKFLDKRTAAISVQSVIEQPAAVTPAPTPAPEPVAEVAESTEPVVDEKSE
jgi:small subunit ribosomal protein S16